MKRSIRHILIMSLLSLLVFASYAQKVRYVELNSTHALSVPENSDYNFEWTITWGLTGNQVNASSTTNVTRNILWDRLTTYHISVRPILASENCYGEAVYMDLIVVEFLSLHTFDDIYYTTQNQPVNGDMRENDVDEQGANIYYTATPVTQPLHGTVEISANGTFIYTPNPGFTGVDQFMYEAYNDLATPMYSNATVTIVVQDKTSLADLYIEKIGPAKALFGSVIEYDIIVKNNGPDAARNVVVKDTMPFGLFDPTYSISGAPVKWSGQIELPTLAANDSIILYVFADISPNSPHWLYNQASTYSDVYDPRNIDNDSIWITEVSAIYADLPGQIFIPSCETVKLPGDKSASNSPIVKYEWIPSTGLSDASIATPTFTPDEQTIGKTSMYILRITDSNGVVASDTTYLVVPEVPLAKIESDTMFINLGENIMVHGDESIGQDLRYFWYTNNGTIIGALNRDSLTISKVGLYNLRITDYLGCQSFDSVTVLLESHPPIIGLDTLSLIAGTDSTINVLLNDRDSNNFDLRVTEIITPPNHSEYTWDADGNFWVKPDSTYWRLDSIQYSVCNNGYPERCTPAWLIIKSIRPPLNADVVVTKTGDEIAFWGDTIHYDFSIYSNGPDTATVVTFTDRLSSDFYNPYFSIDGGKKWAVWNNSYVFRDSLHPGTDVYRIKIRANIRLKAERFIENVAYISTDIKENYLPSDTSRWSTKIKEKVIADAGENMVIGACFTTVDLNGSNSKGENLTYEWTPALHLDDPTSSTPVFANPGVETTIIYRLVVTDDDNITDTAYVTVWVLPPPFANAGPDRFIELGLTTPLDGRKSSGYAISHKWSTSDGHFFGSPNAALVVVDSVGQYTLTVTDTVGCTDTDVADVYQFYYHPFAIPDYYSTDLGDPVSANVLQNDYEPNGIFNMSVMPGIIKTSNGGSVIMNTNGDFTYTPPKSFIGVDNFTYEVCNDAYPPRCSRGYVQITMNTTSKTANLNIRKTAVRTEAVKNDPDGVEFIFKIKNFGPDAAAKVVLTDSLTQYLKNGKYSLNKGTSWISGWKGALPLTNSLPAGDSIEVRIRGTVTSEAPGRIFNAATVTSDTYDPDFEWYLDLATKTENDDNRNVDTISIRVVNDLLAEAILIERNPSDLLKKDLTIGACDNLSVLSAENSLGRNITSYQWAPPEYVTNPNAKITTFKPEAAGKTIPFTLVIIDDSTNSVSTTGINVTVSPTVIANGGPDRKINEGEALTLDATASVGAGATYVWYPVPGSGSPALDLTDPLHPIANAMGVYNLVVTDQHGCTAIDTVTIRENELFVISDIIVVIANGTVKANVGTNDYDPNLDNIYFTGEVTEGPFNGTLQDNPTNMGAQSSVELNALNKISGDGTFVYTPNLDYIGYDYFKYIVCDNNNPDLCREGIVYIKVIDVDDKNSPPVANHDFFFINPGDTINSDLLQNDFDFDGGAITLDKTLIVKPKKGTVQLNDDGKFVYIANSNAKGGDVFTYKICDNGVPSKCDTASVNIDFYKLSSENHWPVAVDDAYFSVGKSISGNVLENDYDHDNDLFEFNILPLYGPNHGEVRFFENGDFIYVPYAGYEGTDLMIYEICEPYTAEQHCTKATLYITNLSEKRYKTDVSIAKTGPETILSGTTITYTLTTTIEGPTLANDIVVSDTLLTALTNKQFSVDGGTTWRTWNLKNTTEQLMLYAKDTLLVRGDIPKVFEGQIVNKAWVSHNMFETDPSNNNSTLVTNVLQRVIADAGIDTTIGACVTKFVIDGTGSVGMGSLTYKWTPAELVDDPSSPSPVYTTEPGTTKIFTLVVSSERDGISNSDTTTVAVTVAPEPVARAGENQWPENLEVVLLNGSSSSGVGPFEYSWWYRDRDDNVVEIATTDTVTVSRSNEYFLTITDAYGCTNTDNVFVEYPIDEYIAVDDYDTTSQQHPLDIYVLQNDLIDEDDDYNYELFLINVEPTHGTYAIKDDSIVVYTPEEYYFGLDSFYYIIGTNLSSNTDGAWVYINVLPLEPDIPEGFSPNGDGINDTWIIGNIELYEFNSVIVFNRWGNIVYEKEKYDNSQPWDGIANKGIRIGKGMVPTGVYLYIVDLGSDKIADRERTGTIYVASDN